MRNNIKATAWKTIRIQRRDPCVHTYVGLETEASSKGLFRRQIVHTDEPRKVQRRLFTVPQKCNLKWHLPDAVAGTKTSNGFFCTRLCTVFILSECIFTPSEPLVGSQNHAWWPERKTTYLQSGKRWTTSWALYPFYPAVKLLVSAKLCECAKMKIAKREGDISAMGVSASLLTYFRVPTKKMSGSEFKK